MNRKGEGVALYRKKKNTLNKNSAENGNPIKKISWVTTKKEKGKEYHCGSFSQTTWAGEDINEAFPQQMISFSRSHATGIMGDIN